MCIYIYFIFSPTPPGSRSNTQRLQLTRRTHSAATSSSLSSSQRLLLSNHFCVIVLNPLCLQPPQLFQNLGKRLAQVAESKLVNPLQLWSPIAETTPAANTESVPTPSPTKGRRSRVVKGSQGPPGWVRAYHRWRTVAGLRPLR
jgi:hypothetical protein